MKKLDDHLGRKIRRIKWYKISQTPAVELTSSNTLRIDYLQPKDFGDYECVIETRRGRGSATFQIILEESSNYELKFDFIENDVRPHGQVVVICESSELQLKFLKFSIKF